MYEKLNGRYNTLAEAVEGLDYGTKGVLKEIAKLEIKNPDELSASDPQYAKNLKNWLTEASEANKAYDEFRDSRDNNIIMRHVYSGDFGINIIGQNPKAIESDIEFINLMLGKITDPKTALNMTEQQPQDPTTQGQCIN